MVGPAEREEALVAGQVEIVVAEAVVDGDGPRALAKDARHALEIGAVTLGHVFGDRAATRGHFGAHVVVVDAVDEVAEVDDARHGLRLALERGEGVRQAHGGGAEVFHAAGLVGTLVVVLVRVLRVREQADGEQGLGAHHLHPRGGPD